MYNPSRISRKDDMLGRNGVVVGSCTAINSRYSGPNTMRRLWVPRPGCRPSGVTLNPSDRYDSAADGQAADGDEHMVEVDAGSHDGDRVPEP